MADNTTLNQATSSGDVIATDDISGVKHQRVKIQYGADGSATDVSDSNPLPIDDAGGSLTVDGTVTANLSATDNAVLDAIDSNTDYGATTGGGTESGALRVTIANDSTGVLSVDDGGSTISIDDGSGSITVDGTVTANLSATDNAVLDSIDSGVGAIVAAEGAALGSGVLLQGDDGTDRKNLNDDATTGDLQVDVTNTVTVDGSGVTQPVSGTVTANLSATDNAVLDNIDADLTTVIGHVDGLEGLLTTIDADTSSLSGAVSGTELQVDVVASLPAGTNNIGDVDIASALPAGTNNIGDVDIASAIPAGTNLVGDVGISGARTSGGTTLYKNIDVDESEDQIKGTAGQVYWIAAFNLATAVRYLKFYNATAASVTVGSTTPDLTFPIPTQNASANGAGFVLSIPNGIAFSTAITIAATTGVADDNSGAPGTNEVVVSIGYA